VLLSNKTWAQKRLDNWMSINLTTVPKQHKNSAANLMKHQNSKVSGIMKWPRGPEIRMSTPEAAIPRRCTIPSDKSTSFLQRRFRRRHPSSRSKCLSVFRLVKQGNPILSNSMKIALLENPTVAQLLRKFPTFYGDWRFTAVFTSAHHWSESWAKLIPSTPYTVSLRPILTSSSQLSKSRSNLQSCKTI
jgi:hypothetical protein